MTAPHRSVYTTIGKLRPGKGWEITRPGKDTDIAKGQFITELNGLRLDTDVNNAAKAIVAFYNYKGASVTISLLEASGQVTQRVFERR